jgi:uncharacterized protein YdhG (YjbR/CyaY superfamily)
MRTGIKTFEDYIRTYPRDVQSVLKKIRQVIKKAAPKAVESISYQMPAFKLNSNPLAYFAGYKNHIGFYPTPSGIASLKKELAPYKQGKGSVQFPLGKPIPYGLIEKIVKFRIKTILENQK